MSVAKVIELSSSSKKSIEDAVEEGVKRANDTIDNIEGVWVKDIQGVVKDGKVTEWRTNLKVTFLLKERLILSEANRLRRPVRLRQER